MNKESNKEFKQAFLSAAISDISAYIQLTDTKVSIIMAAVVGILVGIASCYEPIYMLVKNIVPCSWIGVIFIIFTLLCVTSTILVFVFGILSVRAHSSIINYKSKWFLPQSTKEYSFDEFSKDVKKMSDDDIIENMSAELYKLNDINRQKNKTFKWAIYSFSSLLITLFIIGIVLLISIL